MIFIITKTSKTSLKQSVSTPKVSEYHFLDGIKFFIISYVCMWTTYIHKNKSKSINLFFRLIFCFML